MVYESDLPRFYESLKFAAKRSSSNTLHIFAAVTFVDSAVAVKILTDILRSDSILYSVFPVYGYSEIVSHSLKGMNDSSQPYVAVFINCGATEYLPKLQNAFPFGLQTSVFIIDCHRPIHLSNLSSQQVTVLWALNDKVAESSIFSNLFQHDMDSNSELSDEKEGQEEEDGDDDEEEEEGEEEGVSDDHQKDEEETNLKTREHKDKHKDKESSDDDDDGNENEEENGDSMRSGRKRQRRRRRYRSRGEKQRLRMEYYNRGSFYGRPTGLIMYEIAHSLHKDTNEHLWLACISLTDQLVYSRISMEKYQEGSQELEQQISLSGNFEISKTASIEDGVRVKVPDVNRIHYGKELRLMCLHRWNLFDCMKYSSYPCTKLKTWTEGGMKKLRLFFSQLGIRHSDAQQKFTYMNSDLKHRFKQNVTVTSAEFGLDDFSYKSFQRFHGYKMKVSAADVVHGLTGILESPSPPQQRYEYFWDAISAMDVRGWDILEKGMDRAIQVQTTIVKQAILALAKKSVVKSTHGKQKFQWMLLEDDAEVDMAIITHPLALTRFAHFFMDAQREVGDRPRATVIAAIPPKAKNAFIVGVSNNMPKIGQQIANTFGICFAKAVQRLGNRVQVDYRQDMFDSSYCELNKDQVNVFFQELAIVINE